MLKRVMLFTLLSSALTLAWSKAVHASSWACEEYGPKLEQMKAQAQELDIKIQDRQATLDSLVKALNDFLGRDSVKDWNEKSMAPISFTSKFKTTDDLGEFEWSQQKFSEQINADIQTLINPRFEVHEQTVQRVYNSLLGNPEQDKAVKYMNNAMERKKSILELELQRHIISEELPVWQKVYEMNGCS